MFGQAVALAGVFLAIAVIVSFVMPFVRWFLAHVILLVGIVALVALALRFSVT